MLLPELSRALRRSIVASLVATLIGLALVPSIRASTVLSNPNVSPGSGTTATTFVFTVVAVATQPPVSVVADVSGSGPTVPLAHLSGTYPSGTWRGTASLPAGTWDVEFRWDGPGVGSNDDAIDDPDSVVVTPGGPPPTPTAAPTPTPAPTAPPPPPATPRPTAAPTPRPTVGVTPPPAPGETPAASSPVVTASESPDGSAAPASPAGSIGASAQPSSTSTPSASIAADPASETQGGGPLPWLFLGGAIASSGLAVIGVQYSRSRARLRVAKANAERRALPRFRWPDAP